jgi:hypothetical protein
VDWGVRFQKFRRASPPEDTAATSKSAPAPAKIPEAKVPDSTANEPKLSAQELPIPLPEDVRHVTGAGYAMLAALAEGETPFGALQSRLLDTVRKLSPDDLRGNFLFEVGLYEAAARNQGVLPLREDEGEAVYEGTLLTAAGTFTRCDVAELVAIQPAEKTSEELLVLVNGMGADVPRHREGLQEIADASGCEVVGVHNATGGLTMDVLEAAATLAGVDQGAVTALAQLTLELLATERPFLLAGHSQGGLIVAHALKAVREFAHAQGQSPREIDKLMGRIHVETHGATGFTYPDGPCYVHYHNTKDPIPSTYNRDEKLAAPMKAAQLLIHTRKRDPRAHLGKDAVVMSFSDAGDGSSFGAHRLSTYLAHRVPFTTARGGSQ